MNIEAHFVILKSIETLILQFLHIASHYIGPESIVTYITFKITIKIKSYYWLIGLVDWESLVDSEVRLNSEVLLDIEVIVDKGIFINERFFLDDGVFPQSCFYHTFSAIQTFKKDLNLKYTFKFANIRQNRPKNLINPLIISFTSISTNYFFQIPHKFHVLIRYECY